MNATTIKDQAGFQARMIDLPALPGDRVRLAPWHLKAVNNEDHPGDFGPDARGTVVEVRIRPDRNRALSEMPTDPEYMFSLVAVVQWDGGSVRNVLPSCLLPAPEVDDA